MWRQVMLSIWILLMISSINPLSPAEKLITSGSPGLSSSQNTEDVLLMSSAKALLAEFQDQDEESPSLSRKKRHATGLGYRALPPKTDRPVDSKRFSNFKVDSAPLAGKGVEITKDIYEGGFSHESIVVAGPGGNTANCLLSLAGHLVIDKRVTDIPPGTGKVTRKLVQGSIKDKEHYIIEVDHLENAENVKLIVRPMIVNNNYAVTFQTKATLNIYDVFPAQNADTENAQISSLVVNDGIYIAFFHPKREESLTVAFYSFTTSKLEIIQEFDLLKEPSLEPTFATNGIKDTMLMNIGHQIFLMIGGEDSTLALRMVKIDSKFKFKLDSVLETPANEIRFFKSRFGTFIKLYSDTTLTLYKFMRKSFVNVGTYTDYVGTKFEAQTEETQQMLHLRIANDSMAYVCSLSSFVEAETIALPLPWFRSTQMFSRRYDTFSIAGFGKIKSNNAEKFLLYVMVYNQAKGTYKMKGYEVSFDKATNFYPASTRLESDVEITKLDVEYYNTNLENLKDVLIDNIHKNDLLDKTGAHTYNNLQVGEMDVTGTVIDLPSVKMDVIYQVDSADQVSFTDLDYNNQNSVISDLIVKSTVDTTSDDYLLKKSVLKNADDPVTITAGVTFTVPDVFATNATFSNVATETVSNATEKADVTDFIKDSLKTNADEQLIPAKVSFTQKAETDLLQINPDAVPKNPVNRISPDKMFDITKDNLVDTIKFTNVTLGSEADFQGGVNGIDLAKVVKTTGNDITIAGNKTFSQGMTIDNLSLGGDVNGVECEKYFKRDYIYKEDPNDPTNASYVQEIKTKALKFNTIKVLDHLYLDKMGATDADTFSASRASLGNVVVTNKDANVATGKVIFKKKLNLVKKAITTENLNGSPVDSTFVHDATQVFTSSIDGINNLYVKDNLQVGKMNGVDLDTEVAMVNKKNIFEAEVKFTTLGVRDAITMDIGDEVNGIDVGSTRSIQHYPGTITLTSGTLTIDQDDVIIGEMDFGSIKNQSMLKQDFADEFVYTDTNQVLPNLNSVPSTTTLNVANLSLKGKLDGLNLATEVMHNGSEIETSSSPVFFKNLTTFHNNLNIVNGDKVGPYSLMDLHRQSYCGKGFTKYEGVKTVPQIKSNADVNVPTQLTANGRDFGSKSEFNVAKRSVGNTFSGKMTFTKSLSTSSNVDCQGRVIDTSGTSATPQLCTSALAPHTCKNLGLFDANVVRTDEDATVMNPVEMPVVMANGVNAVITKKTGTLDSVNIFNYLDEKVLLDENRAVNVKLTAPNMKFKEGIKMVPTDGTGTTENTAETYFNGKNLVDYAGKLFKTGDNSVSGKKTVTGTVKVGNDLKFAKDIHPFGVDLPALKSTAFQKSVEQTVSLPYTIGGITQVNKITVDKIDGVQMNDICFFDDTVKCTLTCANSLENCVHFKKNLRASGGISFDKLENIKMSSVLTDLESNDNSYALDELKIPSGGLDWTNDASDGKVSGLLKNSVVKSNKDWSSRNVADTAVQTIAGNVNFDNTVSITDLDVTSGKVNEGLSNEVNPQAIARDGALKVGGNTFTGVKTFTKKVEGTHAKIMEIVNLKEINDLDVEDYVTKVVYSENMTCANLDMAQTITGTWTLSNGINVTGTMDVKGEIDSVKVEDFVRLHQAQPDKNIPKVTFSQGLTVTGNLDANGTGFKSNLDSFMSNRIQLSTDDTINNKLKFTGEVVFKNGSKLVDLNVTKLNNIPSNTWALRQSPPEGQTVSIKTIFNQDTVTCTGDLDTDNINGINLSEKWKDAIKIDEDALITGPGIITFTNTTVLKGQKLSGTLPARFNDTLGTLMVDVSKFVTNLHKFYTDNIVGVIPKLDKEIRIAQRLDLGVVSYLDEVAKPKYLADDFDANEQLKFNASRVSVLELDKNLFSINYRIDTPCSWKSACVCQKSLLSSPLDSEIPSDPSDDPRLSADRTFSFKLSSGTFVLRSSQQSSSNDCKKNGEINHLTISGVFTNPESIDTDMIVLSPTTVGSALKTQDLNLLISSNERKVGYVKSAVMWELGTTIYLAVASGYPNKMVAVFRLDHNEASKPRYTWTREADLEKGNDVCNLKVFGFSNVTGSGTEKHSHLYVVRDMEVSQMWSTQIKEIVIYRQVLSEVSTGPSLPALTEIQGIVGVPGLVDYEVFLHQDKTGDVAQVTLLIGQNYEFALGPDISVAMTLVWDEVYGQYIPAVVPDNVQLIGGEMVKLEEASVNNHKVFIVAERTRLSVYRFVPFQGLRLVDRVQTGVLVDFTVAKKDFQSDHINIYVIEGDRKASMYKLYTKDNVPTLSLKHGYYQ